jgi:hypothetical protein
MNNTVIDYEFTDCGGRSHVLRALNAEGDSWRLETRIDGRTFTRQCQDWQAVERTLSWLRARTINGGVENDDSTPSAAPSLTVLLLAMSLLGASTALAQQGPSQDDGIAAFVHAVEEYALMHRRVSAHLPPFEVTSSADTIRHAIEARAAAIRAERRGAKGGDLFNPMVQATIRARINQALRSRGLTAADVLEEERADGAQSDMKKKKLKVNDNCSWSSATAMLACVLEALPPLPPELAYRMAGADLVLIDVGASLVVDILPSALIGAGGHSTAPPPPSHVSRPRCSWCVCM